MTGGRKCYGYQGERRGCYNHTGLWISLTVLTIATLSSTQSRVLVRNAFRLVQTLEIFKIGYHIMYCNDGVSYDIFTHTYHTVLCSHSPMTPPAQSTGHLNRPPLPHFALVLCLHGPKFHIWENMRYSALYECGFFHLTGWPPAQILFLQMAWFHSFLKEEENSIVYIHHIVFTHLSTDMYFGMFCVWDTVKRAAVSLDLQAALVGLGSFRVWLGQCIRVSLSLHLLFPWWQ